MSCFKQELISIWTWCGALVAVYGVLLVGIGVYYVYYPEAQTVTGHLNPSLWWGAIMVVSGAALLGIPKLAGRGKKEEKR